ncbi:MAG: SAM-dependent methyltransferase [Chloroflexi bacterium HGW-Chloroflexi-10]|nr:MAG: SAM-dependent methyltransferase [Chloroflexi bacterium HGW-Chloroflexi-10]
MSTLQVRLMSALQQRSDLLSETHTGAFRLFNGFLEGCSDLVVEVFGETLVLYDYSQMMDRQYFETLRDWYLAQLPWLRAVLWKRRYSPLDEERAGILLYGDQMVQYVVEAGVRYALDLRMNQDASFYVDTRNLRIWLKETMRGKIVLNTFAYTGSLGVAAKAGGATRVVQTDLNRRFLNLAKTSYTFNGLPIAKQDFMTGDFFKITALLKKADMLFDCLILDPPFFSSTEAGRVNQVQESYRLIQKVRPLVAHQGWLVVVNNALFLSGADFWQILQNQCTDGYLQIENIIPIPADVSGYVETVVSLPPTDPAPFNHSTKIAILRVNRKDRRLASAAT